MPEETRPSRWETRKRRTRQAIKGAAFATFLEHGYLETSVELLIVRAAVSRSTFYAHFPNKLALLGALADDQIGRRHALFRALAALPILDEASMLAWFDDLVRSSRANRGGVALYRLGVALDFDIMRRFSAARDESATILAARFPGFDGTRGDAARRIDRRMAAQAFIVTIEQFSSGLADGSWLIDVDDTQRALTRQLLDRL